MFWLYQKRVVHSNFDILEGWHWFFVGQKWSVSRLVILSHVMYDNGDIVFIESIWFIMYFDGDLLKKSSISVQRNFLFVQ
jgi:hypothetical protein